MMSLPPGAAVTERTRGEVAAILVEQVECHEERRRSDGVGVRIR